MKVMTCNIRCYGADDGPNGWVYRKDLCIDVIRSREPEIICFQEVWREQLDDLRAAFPGFAWAGMVDVPDGWNPTNAIFYRGDRFELLSSGGFWLSETPHISGSSSWDSACVRLANWVRLQVAGTGTEFRVVNTHLDHVSQEARENQARLVNEDAAAYGRSYGQVLTGDMNCDSSNPSIGLLRAGGWRDTYAAVHGTEDPGHTFHRFQGPDYASTVGKMDWVFVRGQAAVTDAEVIRDSRDGRFPSDHYFVSADMSV